jgi:formate-dependent nitrite reductase membrane component NrfD
LTGIDDRGTTDTRKGGTAPANPDNPDIANRGRAPGAGDVVQGAAERAAGVSGSNTITREGPAEPRGAEQALTGQAGGRTPSRTGGRRKRGDKNAVVPDAEFTSYYGRPIVKAAPWEVDIPAYLFMGGVAAGSSLLSAGADLTDRPALRRTGRLGALVGLTLSMIALVHDLGRPARFHHMLRVAKPTSPMSVGTWILTAYGPFAGLAAVSELRALLPRRLRSGLVGRLLGLSGRPAGLVAATVAPAVASYTAVLLSDTATPTWHAAHKHLPFVFVGSASAASGGLGMIGAPVAEAGPARRLAVGGALLELAVEHKMERAMGITAEPLHEGGAGRLMKASKALTVAGTLGTLAVGGRSRLGAVASGAALLAGSACLRFGVFEAGQDSARDPRYTVVPQRERVERQGRTTAN